MNQIQTVNALAYRAAELRQAFDRSFAKAPRDEEAPTEAFLSIDAADDPYALRLAEISGLFVDKKVTPLPSGAPDLLGLASFRGVLVPIYDLRVLLGYPAGPRPRWLVLTTPKMPVGLAFDRFDGYLDISREAVAPEARPHGRRPYVNEIVRVADSVRAVIHLPAVLEAITNRASSSPAQKE